MPVNEEMFIEDAIRIAKVICLKNAGTERTAIQMLIDEAEKHNCDCGKAKEATTEKTSAVGNAAAMRESLVAIRKALLLDSGMGPCTEFHAEVDRLTATALSTPARNCDRFESVQQARSAYCSECGRIISIWDGDESFRFEKWLLAPAESETKGENDGR